MNKFVALVLILCLVGFVWYVGCSSENPPAKKTGATTTTAQPAQPAGGGAGTAPGEKGAMTPKPTDTPPAPATEPKSSGPEKK